jgi:hypothetical protein
MGSTKTFASLEPYYEVRAMANYDKIKAAIDYESVPSLAIEAKHPDDADENEPRKFLAYILGKSRVKGGGSRYSVLAYQYAGHNTSSDDAKKWRCFKVDELEDVELIDFEQPTPPVSIPDPLSADDVKRQNCVDIPGNRIVREADYEA